MLNHVDYENYFNELNISTEDGIILLNYLEGLSLIGIEYLKNKQIKEFYND